MRSNWELVVTGLLPERAADVRRHLVSEHHDPGAAFVDLVEYLDAQHVAAHTAAVDHDEDDLSWSETELRREIDQFAVVYPPAFRPPPVPPIGSLAAIEDLSVARHRAQLLRHAIAAYPDGIPAGVAALILVANLQMDFAAVRQLAATGAEVVTFERRMHPGSSACDACYDELPDQFRMFPTICPHRLPPIEVKERPADGRR